MSLLRVENLEVSYRTPDGTVRAVDGLDFDIAAGEALGIVGESGSGKSQTALAIMGLLAPGAQVSGRIIFDGEDLLRLGQGALNRVRGARIGMIFQDPMTSLNPHLRIGTQMREVLQQHRKISGAEAERECVQMLDAVRIGGGAARLRQYPHEFSGGQRQRLMIAMTLLCRPQLLIADEPTTALDVTVQAQVLELLAELRREFGLAVMLITHDLGVVAEVCERALVMYGGRLMECGDSAALMSRPAHPYTRGLLDSRPRLDTPRHQRLTAIPGQPRDPRVRAPGCAFEPRCAQRLEVCAQAAPAPIECAHGLSACHLLTAPVISTPSR